MKAAIASIRKELAETYPKEETESLIFLIFEKLKGYSRTQFLLAADESLNEADRNEIENIIGRLKNHEPIQYILGMTEFYGLPFYTVPEVLIPRPETEELVHWIIQENKLLKPTILDVGTGTGCIAISLRKNIPESTVFACDISPVCVETARKNAKLNASEVLVFEYDILNGTPEFVFRELDIIVSNPPYVLESEKLQMEKNVLCFEPGLALFVPDYDPLRFYKSIAEFARVHLKNRGILYFEINEALGGKCSEMLKQKGFSGVNVKKDIHGKDRFVVAVLLESRANIRNQ